MPKDLALSSEITESFLKKAKNRKFYFIPKKVHILSSLCESYRYNCWKRVMCYVIAAELIFIYSCYTAMATEYFEAVNLLGSDV